MKKLFGGGGGGGGSSKLVPQPLSSNQTAPSSSSQQSNDRDLRGQSINVGGMNVVIENKLAEGGFSIVFLVKHYHPRQNSAHCYALKRQFVNEPALLEACRREIEITRTLGVHHPNIITYIASSLTALSNSDGNVYEYLLLTQYYRGSVLRLMNERLAIGQWLSIDEVLRIFTDVCAAVARLHHCQTPVIHRDLKVENLLLDEDGRCVLCDFGSATTRTLSVKTPHSRTLVEDEIARFTTLSYRAPEMIDLYAGQAITTKVDIWALGVMLYKLCYFALPFGESALGIQNAAFSFPAEPTHFPHELLGLIVYMLTPDIERRPDIYQVSSIAYRLRNCQCPVKNLNSVNVPDNAFLLRLLRDHGSQKYSGGVSSAAAERASRTPNNDTPSSQIGPISSTTSVAPRQRPKPRRGLSPAGTPTLEPSLVPPPLGSTPPIGAGVATVPPHVVQRLIEQNPTTPNATATPAMPDAGSSSAILMTAAMSRSVTREEVADSQQFEMTSRPPLSAQQQQQYQQHRRNASDPSAALLDSTHLSAFKPYKSQQHVPSDASTELSTAPASWNPFDLDDHSFGLSFDALPRQRKDSNASTVNVKSRESLIIDGPSSSTAGEIGASCAGAGVGLDPFGAAPFRPRPQPPPKPANAASLLAQQKKKNSLTESLNDETTLPTVRPKTSSLPQGPSAIATSSLKLKKGYKKLIEDGGGVGLTEALRVPPASVTSNRMRGADSDSVGSASDLQARMQASGSSTGDEDENVTIGKTKEISVVDVKRGGGGHGHRRRRVRRTTSSDENEEDDDDEENRSTDEGESAAEGEHDSYARGNVQRFDVDDEEDLNNKLKSASFSGAVPKIVSTSTSSGAMLLDEGGIEGSYLEQEMIGRQPLLADDDDDEQQHHHHHHQTPSQQHQQHLTSIILPGVHHHKNAGGSTATKPESLELSILGSGGANSATTIGGSGDVFRRAPFLASQQQQAFRTASSSTSSSHQRQQYQQTTSAGQATAFVNTSFQGDEALRLD